jgi:hypothetical protein
VILSIDNGSDRSGQVRLELLRAVESLGAEGLPAESLREWAAELRGLAAMQFHEGPERTDFVARSYVMEGRQADAAREYARFPDSQQASTFFGRNPDLRAPASAGETKPAVSK